MDKYDDMPDEELAAKTLAMMGYTQYYPSLWMNKGVVHKEWQIGDILFSPESHAFAAEVKGWMMRDWNCDDNSYSYSGPDSPTECEGHVSFNKMLYHKDDDNYSCEIEGCAGYGNMAAHPRAVCTAALRAVDNESTI